MNIEWGIPIPINMEHHMRKVLWEIRSAIEGSEEALIWWWDCWGRLFRTVAAFQPGRDR